MKRLVYLLLMAALVSCSEEMGNPGELGENEGIIGTWVEFDPTDLEASYGYTDTITYLQRMPGLDSSSYGFIIRADGTFTERKNSGWCATPPISYANFEGNWTALSDSLLDITVDYWGGVMTYQVRILSVDSEVLKIRYLFTEDRTDAR